MGAAFFWGLFAGSSLVLGGILALSLHIRTRRHRRRLSLQPAGGDGGEQVGLLTTVGFGFAFALTTLE